MREDNVPRGPLTQTQKRPRDDTLRYMIGYLAMTVTALAAIGVLFLLARLDDEHTPALDPPREIAPPPIDTDNLARAVAAGVAVAIGSPQPIRGEIVFLEPTPTRTPAKPTAMPTTGPMTCPDNPNVLPEGSICLGKAPVPTPTVMPSCVAPPVPATICMVRSGASPSTPLPLFPTPVSVTEGERPQ